MRVFANRNNVCDNFNYTSIIQLNCISTLSVYVGPWIPNHVLSTRLIHGSSNWLLSRLQTRSICVLAVWLDVVS